MMQTRRSTLASLAAVSTLAACGRGGGAAPADTLRIGLGGAPDSLDPLKAEFAISALLFRQIWLPLTRKQADGSIGPGVAESWTAAPDAKLWTFKVRPGLKWSDGSPLTAEDVVASFRIAADPETAFPDAPDLYRIQGFPEAVTGKAPTEAIGVRALPDGLVEITLSVPDAGLHASLDEFYPVPVAVRAKHGMAWTQPENIVVSGPYKPVRMTQTEMTFEANPNFATPAPIKTVFVQAIDDAATRGRMFRAGDLDLAQDPPLGQLEALKERFGDQLKRYAAPRIFYLSFNTSRPALADPALRRALGQVVDRDLIAQTIFRGAVDPAYQLLRGPMRHSPQGKAAFEAAAAAVKAAGYSPEKPLKLELAVVNDERARVALLVQDMWKPLGVEVEIFGGEQTGIVTKLNQGEFDVGLTRLDRGLKDSGLEMLEAFSSRGTAKSHRWVEPKFDALLDQARAIPIGAERDAFTDQAEALMHEASPIAPLYFAPALWLCAPRVAGAGDSPLPPVFWDRLRLA
jgi:oligopeptide transport system substrate-binding protein